MKVQRLGKVSYVLLVKYGKIPTSARQYDLYYPAINHIEDIVRTVGKLTEAKDKEPLR